MIKVGVYCNNYRPEDGGANSLVNTIAHEIASENDGNIEYVFIYNGNKAESYEKNIGKYRYLNVNSKKILSIDFLSKLSRLTGIEFTKRLESLVRKEKIDILWFTSPFYTYITTPFIFPVWDLGHRTTEYPEVSKWYIVRARDFMYEKMLNRAKYVLSGNETGKKEIMKYYGIDTNKIAIAQFPVSSFCFGKATKPKFEIPDKYFFYPAQFWYHKNHCVILKALKILKQKYGYAPKVFFTGSDHGSLKFVKKNIDALKLSDQVTITGFLKAEELKYLYLHATAMIFASMMGPNNLPPLEAEYLRCPVIITDLTGHIEQMGDVAIYFNGNDEKDLAEKMLLLLTDTNYRNKIVRKESLMQESIEKINYTECVKNNCFGH